MKLRKQHPTRTVSIDEDVQAEDGTLPREIADWAPSPEDLYSRSELREIVTRTLEKLRPSLSVVFVLRDVEGLSVEETAEALALSAAAVKTRLLRARLQLRERLNRYFTKDGEFAGAELGRAMDVVKTLY
jgi:RNA polymerase sigma-70 factor (ECF subfamily)